jgi:predicted secreted protein
MFVNQIEKDKMEFSDNFILERVSNETRKSLKINFVKVTTSTNPKFRKHKYSKENPKHIEYFYKGFDLLQYTIVVKPFILKKFNIEKPIILDVLLYLFPFQLFSANDFKLLPIQNINMHIKTLTNIGYIAPIVEEKYRGKKVFKLTDTAQKIVREYYMYLSGEKTISEGKYKNPFNYKDVTKVDKVREEVMLKLKRQSETRRSKFGDSFY